MDPVLQLTDSRDFIDLADLDGAELRRILSRAHAMKARSRDSAPDPDAGLLERKTLAMIFDKPSTRTRVSFDVAMRQLGGETIVLNRGDMQLGRGETIADTARVMSRYVDAIVLRTGEHSNLTTLAQSADIPVINGLTNLSHPCQILADIMTFEEHRGPVEGRMLAWVGDGNNVAASWVQAAVQFGFALRLGCPARFSPRRELIDWAAARDADVKLMQDPNEAVAGAAAVMTDTWVSMGDGDPELRIKELGPFQVNGPLMAHAAPDAIFMHCLPAHRGNEVSDEVIDGPQSVVFDEAENRMHIQKAILAWCFGKV